MKIENDTNGCGIHDASHDISDGVWGIIGILVRLRRQNLPGWKPSGCMAQASEIASKKTVNTLKNAFARLSSLMTNKFFKPPKNQL
jgi:hypothetical protein